ncbi:hypothetical protein ACPSM1_19480 [Micromonospora chersina]|uniref:hypothetical protein n=1 Tax=Micromonospora chersina TaxID=47854 RepID=UPI003C9656DD
MPDAALLSAAIPRAGDERFDNVGREVDHRDSGQRVVARRAVRRRETGENGWGDEPWRCWVDDMINSDPSILDEIQQWWDTTSPVPMVGSRHHTVPRRYLERFSASGQIRVRDRVTGQASRLSLSPTTA